ncbi:exodeoxyribonuclease III [Cryptococcus neoformans]|nr:exodeoxyribonuclease III [Cryptococcus neoformans var. grubii]OXC59631.1 exodeoxyribonuclease III [Cryptococcus neoformans var. grubii MW-RSA852]UOH83515.1 exodeoxyribonuclease III [Cryptococcus neoformans]
MRILTWNVNVLRTCLDYHPFSSMEKKNIEGLLDELGAQILCFQEHKTVRTRLEKSMACPGPYDGFWTFPRSKTGYSGVCTYVDSRYCVPLKAEEGITGLLLGDRLSTMKPPWTDVERIGSYPDVNDMEWMDELDGTKFDVKKLDMEGRAVVCDFGLFVLFNLYCPNETNNARRPYKMNYLHALQERVHLLQAAGREVILVGDINIVRQPMDSGEGPVRSSAEQHYSHPARRILDDWCAPKGPMIDVVRESWPQRDDMFTCWNQKLDARSANYGSRIDYVLCTPGLRPWIKGGDILPKVYGSDHCPVYVDLHESIITSEGETLHLRDMLNPKDRPSSTSPVYPNDAKREAPEPPRFATKFMDEFSGRQTSLKSFFGGGSKRAQEKTNGASLTTSVSASASPTPTPTASELSTAVQDTPSVPAASKFDPSKIVSLPQAPEESLSAPFNLARAAFSSLDNPSPVHSRELSSKTNGGTPVKATSSSKQEKSNPKPIDMTLDDDEDDEPMLISSKSKNKPPPKPTRSSSSGSKLASSQAKLSSFFSQPNTEGKRKSPPLPSSALPTSKRPSLAPIPQSNTDPFVASPSGTTAEDESQGMTEEENQLISQAIAEADAERAEKNAKAAPQWSSLFAKKLPPLCTVHHKPCKDFIVMKPGPNKGKRFWLCSLPVGAGYDMGRSKRPREDVNPKFRCNFFLWDSANSRKETSNEGKEKKEPEKEEKKL